MQLYHRESVDRISLSSLTAFGNLAGMFQLRPFRPTFLLTTLAIVLGSQLIRLLFPSIAWYLRDTVRPGVGGLVIYAFAPFLMPFLLPALVRGVGAKRVLWIAGIGLSFFRLAEQLSNHPAWDLWLGMGGVVCFLWVLPLLLGLGQDSFVYGFIFGLGLDISLKMMTHTLDWSWIPGILPILAVLLLGGTFITLLWGETRSDPHFLWGEGRATFPLMGIGVLLFIQGLVLNNVGWITTVNGYSWGFSLILILVSGTIGMVLAHQFMSKVKYARFWIIAFALMVPVAMWQADSQTDIIFVAVLAGLLPALLPAQTASSKILSTAIFFTVGQLFFVAFGLLYYLALDMPLPFEQEQVRVTAGIFLSIILLATLPTPKAFVSKVQSWEQPVAVGLILLLLMGLWDFGGGFNLPAQTPLIPTNSVRVMSYNIHSAFSSGGQHNPEEIARVIESADADIIGVQEISRGWMIDGSTDLFLWLQRRLDMPYAVFHATADPVWGNTIFSKYPIIETEEMALPRFETRIPRGVVGAQINLGNGQELLFMSTHLHHRADDLTAVHLAQVDKILSTWNERPHTILVGDMNARPGWVEMEQILSAGFVDSWVNAGIGDGFTTNAVDPKHRIDWIFHTPDLESTDAQVYPSQASDHFSVAVTISFD